MTRDDKVFVVDVMVVTDLTREMVAMSVISRPTGAAMKFSVIVKICKYRMFHEGHRLIPIAMEVHNAFEHDMDHFMK
jgi:hypothetical protein